MRPEINLFLLLLFFDLGVFCFAGWRMFLTKKWCDWLKGVVGPKRVALMTLLLLPFIMVCCNLWDSLFGPDHPLSSWIMVLSSDFSHEVELTMFLDKTKNVDIDQISERG